MRTTMLTMDTSTKKSGISVFKNGIYTESLLLNFESVKKMDERFPLMVKNIIQTLEEYHPDIIYIEEAVVLKNADTQRFLLRIQGAVYVWCLFHNCEFNTIRPTEWRKSLDLNEKSINGGRPKKDELKQRSIQYVKKLLGYELQEDVAESLCIGISVLKKWNINFEKITDVKFKEIS